MISYCTYYTPETALPIMADDMGLFMAEFAVERDSDGRYSFSDRDVAISGAISGGELFSIGTPTQFADAFMTHLNGHPRHTAVQLDCGATMPSPAEALLALGKLSLSPARQPLHEIIKPLAEIIETYGDTNATEDY